MKELRLGSRKTEGFTGYLAPRVIQMGIHMTCPVESVSVKLPSSQRYAVSELRFKALACRVPDLTRPPHVEIHEISPQRRQGNRVDRRHAPPLVTVEPHGI